MPKKQNIKLNITHTFADGRVMTDKEFMEKPFVVEYEKNREVYEQAERMFNPNYFAAQKAKRELTAKRKEELQAEAERIKKELSSL